MDPVALLVSIGHMLLIPGIAAYARYRWSYKGLLASFAIIPIFGSLWMAGNRSVIGTPMDFSTSYNIYFLLTLVATPGMWFVSRPRWLAVAAAFGAVLVYFAMGQVAEFVLCAFGGCR